MNEKKHNGIVGLWKFIFSVVVVLFHTNNFYKVPTDNPLFRYGYIAVEFFFLISGYYFAKAALKGEYSKEEIGNETVSFIGKKFMKLFPYVLLSYIVAIVYMLKFTRPLTTDTLANSIWNLFLVKEFGFRGPPTLAPIWYLTGMLASMFVLYPIVKKHKTNYIKLIAPIIVLVGFGYLSNVKVGLDFSNRDWLFYSRSGMARAFIEINLGMILYIISDALKNIEYRKFFKALLTIGQHALLIMVLYVTTFIKKSPSYDYIMLLMIAISVLIMTSGKTYDYKLLSNKFVAFLEDLSLPIFICQFGINQLFAFSILQDMNPTHRALINLGVIILLALIELIIVKVYKKMGINKKLLKLAIKE